MTVDFQKKIEESAQFKLFLVRFGVKWIREYETFTEAEQAICLDVFLSLYPNFGK